MHFISGKHIPRRHFLQGMGAMVGLPMLDAMIPAGVRKGAMADAPTRFVAIEEVHGLPGCNTWGASQNLFAPEQVGRDFEIMPDNVLASLSEYRDYLTIVSNTDVRMAEAFSPEEIGGDHFRSSAVFLTQSHPKQTQGSDLHVGVSLDQVYAQRFGQETVLPSLQLCIEPTDKGGGCDYNYSCSYTDSISWASPDTPLPQVRNPRAVFDMLFGAGGSEAERVARRRAHSSILDWVQGEVAHVKRDLGATDRQRVDRYLDSVREIERRIQLIETQNSSGEERELPEAPAGVPDSFREHMELMFDLQVLAFESDTTRVVSFKTGRDASNRTFPESGSDSGFHPASHHGDREDRILDFHKISSYRVSMLQHFVERLKNTPYGDSNLLDQTVVMWGSPMGDANLHNHRRCPLFFLGRGNGALEGGVHYRAPDGTPMANVFVSLMQNLGFNDLTSFGDSTGEFLL